MIDIWTERMLSLLEAAKHIPGRPHISTLRRWSGRGARGVQLETIEIGGRRFTSVEAIDRFLAKRNGANSVQRHENINARRQRDIEQAERDLDES